MFMSNNAQDRGKYANDGPDPYVGFMWKIEVAGVIYAHFQELSGLTWDTEVVSFQEGGRNDSVHQLMGQTKYSNIVLKNGFSSDQKIWQWRSEVINPGTRPGARRNGSVMLLRQDLSVAVQWNFIKGWPCKWDGPNMTSSSSQLAIETLEIAYERLELAQAG